MFVPPSPLAEPAVLELLARAGTDPADGLQIVALHRLAARPFDPGVALLLLPAAPGARRCVCPPLPVLRQEPRLASPSRLTPLLRTSPCPADTATAPTRSPCCSASIRQTTPC